MRKRNIKKQIWLNENEDNLLKEKAKKVGMSEAEFVRNLIKDIVPREKPDDRFYEVMKTMRSISISLNQIAKKANALNYIDEPYYKREAERFDKFRLEIREKYLLSNKI